MSATVIRLPPITVADPVRASFADLLTSCKRMRATIATTDSLSEAFDLYEQLKATTLELTALVDLAADRCDQILEKL